MTGPVRVGADIEGEAAALAVAAALDELAPAVSAFETREPASGEPALWRIEAWPAAPVLNPDLEIRLALLAAGGGGGPAPPVGGGGPRGGRGREEPRPR